MGWKESSVMDERCRPVRRPDGFVLEAESRGANISEICRRYGFSRKMGYKWLLRHEQEGLVGLYALQAAKAGVPVAIVVKRGG